MIVISNTSPLINLAIVGKLELLQKLYNQIFIPPAVYDEIVIDGAELPGANEVKTYSWITVHEIKNDSLVKTLELELDRGEAQAIALAAEINSDILLLDEKNGRKVANRLGVQVIGILGVLIIAKKEGFIDLVKPILDDLISQAGFRVSDKLYDQIIKSSGE